MKKLIHYYNANIGSCRAFRQVIVVKGPKSVVKCPPGYFSLPNSPQDQEFMASMINSLKSLEIGISVLLIMISLELMASMWSTFTM